MKIDDVHPIIKKHESTFLFLDSAYEGKKAWFNDYPLIVPEKTYTTSRNTLILNLSIADCFLPREELELDPKFANKYYLRLRRSRWKPLFKETIRTFSGILSGYKVKDETLNWLSMEQREKYLGDVDLEGNDHFSFFAKCDRLSLMEGWCAIWVNSPEITVMPQNYLEQKQLDYRPYFQVIKRSQIVNYEMKKLLNGENKITKLVYTETVYENGEKIKKYVEILVGAVNTYLPKKNASGIVEYELDEEKTYDLDYIPIVFYPSNNIDPFDDDFPLLEIAEDNRIHYQIYSDYRESLHYQSLPVFVRIGLLQQGGTGEGLDPIAISPYAVVDLPENGDLKIIETSGVAIGLNKAELEKIEADVIAKSLSFLDGQSTMTATEANLRSTQFKATFEVYADQKASSIAEIFNIWADWQGVTAKGQGIILSDSVFKLISPQMIEQFRSLLTEGALDIESFWKLLDSWGTLPKGIDVKEILRNVIGATQENQTPRDTLEPVGTGQEN